MILAPNSLSATFTRPADTVTYAGGDLVANSTTAGSVTPLSWAVGYTAGWKSGYNPIYIPAFRIRKTKALVTNAAFRLHLYLAQPIIATTGDNGVFGTVVSGNASWLSSYDTTMVALHSDGASGLAVPTEGSVTPTVPTGTTLYGLVEALAAYAPASAEVFTFEMLYETVTP